MDFIVRIDFALLRISCKYLEESGPQTARDGSP